jgi:hypothetical protein
MEKRTITWSFNGEFYPTVQLPSLGFTKLYPAVVFLSNRTSITIDFTTTRPILPLHHPRISPFWITVPLQYLRRFFGKER